MGHGLYTVDGRTAILYAGEVSWHRLGIRLTAPAAAGEAVQAAGMDTRRSGRGGASVAVCKAVVRTDANDVLNVVGDCGRPIQNTERLALIDTVSAKGGRPRGSGEGLGPRCRGPGL